MSESIEAITGFGLGFAWFQTVCPSHKFSLDKKYPLLTSYAKWIKNIVHSKRPTIKTKRVSLVPNFQIEVKNRKIWIHHWMWLGIILGFLVYMTPANQLLFLKSLVTGGTVHGILYKDRFKIVIPAQLQQSPASGQTPKPREH